MGYCGLTDHQTRFSCGKPCQEDLPLDHDLMVKISQPWSHGGFLGMLFMKLEKKQHINGL